MKYTLHTLTVLVPEDENEDAVEEMLDNIQLLLDEDLPPQCRPQYKWDRAEVNLP